MADGTPIEWTDATWNPITGCSVVSPGCTNCYAMKLAGSRLRNEPSRAGLTRQTKGGAVWTGEVRFNERTLDQPLHWRRPRMIFVCAHADLFHENVPDEWIDRIFAVMALAPQHQFQVLTKRPERMRAYLTADDGFGPWGRVEHRARQLASVPIGKTLAHLGGGSLPNVWLGVSVEDQLRADTRVPILLETPAAVRWVSAEPLLGPIDFTMIPTGDMLGEHILCMDALLGPPDLEAGARLDWVVVGGESGKGARPMHPEWVRSIRDQCSEAGAPFLFKQWGEWGSRFEKSSSGEMVFRTFDTFQTWVNKAQTWVAGGICLDRMGQELRIGADFMRARDEGRFPVTVMHSIGKKRAGRLLDGELHDGFPSLEVPFG
ncbi:phage Gp37/Gp68 family protein [Aureimonas sp. D3]|uniref:phage Gp37/Gp68 family protein n=1 Tax=Aureimonas sp. D3 TaxID=1638164 RepID=UPI00078555DE|nr:phage Gp37/Gp68 family protein [Aureimonas sp. D3]